MTATGLPSTGAASAENELLAQLGLPPSASPEDVDHLHLAASEYLAAAPAELRGWAHAQAKALDLAYLTLTDPVGLRGSALRSPARPPTVVPGGPATPPARRGSAAAASPVVPLEAAAPDGPDEPIASAADEPELEDFEALYASVTPSAHTDMGPSQSTKAKPARVAPATRRVDVAAGSRAPRASNPWKRVAIGTITLAAILGVVVGGYALGGGSDDPAAPPAAAQASSGAPSIDQAKVADLMAKFQADPKDVTTLMALANEFYAGGEYDTAGTWLDKVLAIDAGNVEALLAQGAVAFNNADLASAKATWDKVVAIDPKNVEAHYDLGFLYLNQQTPDWGGVQREWNEVVALDPESDLAKSVKAHLESLASASMLPGTSPAAQGASPAASPAATPASSPAASTQP